MSVRCTPARPGIANSHYSFFHTVLSCCPFAEAFEPSRRPKRGGRFAPEPTVLSVVARADDELRPAVLSLSYEDQHVGRDRGLMARQSLSGAVQAGVGEV